MTGIDFLAVYGLHPGTFAVEVLESGAVLIRGEGGEVSLPPPSVETVSATVIGAPFAFISRGMARVEPPAITAAPVANVPETPPQAAPGPITAPPKRGPLEACPRCGHAPPHRPGVFGQPMLYCISCTLSYDP